MATDNPKCVSLYWVPTADLLFGPDAEVFDRHSFRQFRDTIGMEVSNQIL